jgi:hypothetical protein
MSLKEDIDKLKEQSSRNIPEEMLNLMLTDTESLKQSGIVEKSLKAGDKAPSFLLPNVNGEIVSLEELLARGPVVLNFYRGGW